MRYDIAIIGTGPAGLEAAITAKIRNKNILLLGSKDLSTKLQAAHEIKNYLGLPLVSGKDMAAAFQASLDSVGVEITEKRATAVYQMKDYYALQLDDNSIAEATAVILATGVVNGKPLTGESTFLGRGVSYCATCDGSFYKGKTVAVIADSAHEEQEVDFLAELCAKVLYFPLYKNSLISHDNVEIHSGEVPVEIQGAMKVNALVTKTQAYAVDGVFILRQAQFPDQLVPGIQTNGNAITVDLQMKTNLPGLFAAGDITGTPYQYIKSSGQGNVAALSAVQYIDILKAAH